MYPDKEHILGAASNIFKPSLATIEPSKFEAFLFNFQLRDCIMFCNRTLDPLSPCIEKYYNNEYGNSYKNQTEKYMVLCSCI